MTTVRIAMLRQLLEYRLRTPVILRLYVNEEGGRAGEPQIEPEGGGYIEIALAPGAWSVANRSDSIAEASYPALQFMFDGTNRYTVYGSYLVGDGEVLYVDPLEEPFKVQREFDALRIVPVIALQAVGQ